MNSTPFANVDCPHRVFSAGSSVDTPARADIPGDPQEQGGQAPAGADHSSWHDRVHGLAPVAYSPTFDAWLVSGYSEVLTVLRNPRVFSSLHNLEPASPWPEEVRRVLDEGYPLAPALQNNDPPFHTHIRMLYSETFAPARLARLASAITALCHDLVDQFAADGQADLRARLAVPVALTTIADVLGVPRSDVGLIGSWYDSWSRMYLPGVTLDQQIEGARSLVDFQRYCAALLDKRRSNPSDDLATTLVQARLDGIRPLSRAEMTTHMILLCSGAHAASNLICNALLHMALRPAPWRPEQFVAVIEEVLRLESPVQISRRRVTEPFELHGVLLPKDAYIYVLLGPANRDMAVFERADLFDLQRPDSSRHLAFGWGAHFCVGAELARTETRVVLGVLGQRLTGLRLPPGWAPVYQPNLFVHAPSELPLVWDPPAA